MRRAAIMLALVTLGGCTAITDVGRYTFGPERDGGEEAGMDGGVDAATDGGAMRDARSTCGDGVVASDELCDDGNFADGDGCSAECVPEPGWECYGESPTTCVPLCGDMMVVGIETCDDGFVDDCGSCDATCTGLGTGAACGDAVVCPEYEFCDDGFNDDCGTCNFDCLGEGAGALPGDGSICPETESCDDGDTDAGDGCDPTGAVEAGWECTGEPSVCRRLTCASDADCSDGEYCDSGSLTCAACLPMGEACAGSNECCAGVCDPTTGACGCPPSQTNCGDFCVDLSSDDMNCGSCNNSCTGFDHCRDGHCMAF